MWLGSLWASLRLVRCSVGAERLECEALEAAPDLCAHCERLRDALSKALDEADRRGKLLINALADVHRLEAEHSATAGLEAELARHRAEELERQKRLEAVLKNTDWGWEYKYWYALPGWGPNARHYTAGPYKTEGGCRRAAHAAALGGAHVEVRRARPPRPPGQEIPRRPRRKR